VRLNTVSKSVAFHTRRPGDGLETTGAILPSFVKLYPDLHTSEYHFFSALKIDAQLYYISIIHRKGS
jgi:hypothetical protein